MEKIWNQSLGYALLYSNIIGHVDITVTSTESMYCLKGYNKE